MKKKMVRFAAALALCLSFASCDNFVAKQLGGSTTIELEKGQKLIMATWKEDNSIWYMTEPMDSDYTPKTKVFQGDSQFGMMEGKVVFVESR